MNNVLCRVLEGDSRAVEIFVSLIAGILGGNAAGAVLKPLNLGMLSNSLVGLFGGLIANLAAARLYSVAALAEVDTSDAAKLILLLFAAGACGFCMTLLAGILRQATNRR